MTPSVSVFKSLAPNEYAITPFRAYASHNYLYVSGAANNSDDVKVLFGKKYSSTDQLRVANDSQELFDSIVQTFYSPLPYTTYGIQSGSSYHPTSSVFVISATQNIFGQEIVPGTFRVTIGANSLIDDTYGNLITSQSGVPYTIGRIFYDKGIGIIQPTAGAGAITQNGISIINGTNVRVQFSSSVQLFEHNIRVRLDPTDFLFSLYNPSVTSSIYTGSNKTPLELMVSQSLYPYITTIGLFNQENELLAVAKVSNPIQRTDYSVQTFVVKFDTEN